MSGQRSAEGTFLTHASMLDLHEIQATVLRLRPAPYFGSHVTALLRATGGVVALGGLALIVTSA